LEGRDVFLASETDVLEQVLQSILTHLQKKVAEPKITKRQMEAFRECLRPIERDYLVNPSRRLVHVWPSINDNSPNAQESIKDAITSSLKNQKRDSTITFVGVALKYSLKLFDAALADVHKSGFKHDLPKALHLRLVHMDDYSQALHVLGSGPDVDSIRRNFNKGWNDRQETWMAHCAAIGIDLQPDECRTDFVPARVGILIDDHVLYEGSCSYERASNDAESGPREFRLMVGELEYIMYRTNSKKFDSEVARKKIKEFRSFFDFYKLGSQNSIMFVPDGTDWSMLLKDGLRWYTSINKVIFISNKGEKFKDLCILAAELGKEIDYYVRRPANEVEAQRLQLTFNHPKIHLKYFESAPTFRAVLFDELLIGMQMYSNGPPGISPTCLRLIATQFSDRFAPLMKLMHDFIGTSA
jgi:hypothetical protein